MEASSSLKIRNDYKYWPKLIIQQNSKKLKKFGFPLYLIQYPEKNKPKKFYFYLLSRQLWLGPVWFSPGYHARSWQFAPWAMMMPIRFLKRPLTGCHILTALVSSDHIFLLLTYLEKIYFHFSPNPINKNKKCFKMNITIWISKKKYIVHNV